MKAIPSKMALPAAISPAKVVNLSRSKDVRFNTWTTRPLLPSDFLISKFPALTIGSRQAYRIPLHSLRGTRWNFRFKHEDDSPDEAEFLKHASRSALPVFNAKDDKNVQQVAKSNRPRMSVKERNPKHLNSSSSRSIEVNYFQVLKYPLATELAMQEMIHKNTLVFVVDKHADKKDIKAAVEKVSNVETKKVNTLVMPDGNKKAYVTLRPNHNALEVAKKLRII